MANNRLRKPRSTRGKHREFLRSGLRLVSAHSNETQLISDILCSNVLLPGQSPRRLADVGCGYGRFAAVLAPFVQEILLLDPDSIMLASAMRKLASHKQKVDAICGRVEDLPHGFESNFDLILLSHVLYYTKDWKAVIDRCLSWLAPDGRLIVVLWSRSSDLFRLSPQPTGSELTSETIIEHLVSRTIPFKSIHIAPTIRISSKQQRKSLVRFLGYTDEQAMDKSIDALLARSEILVDHQGLIIIGPSSATQLAGPKRQTR